MPIDDHHRAPRRGRRRWAAMALAGLATGVLTTGVLVTSASPAWAAPSPIAGPTTGGTTVTDLVPGVTLTGLGQGGGNAGFGIGDDGRVYAWGFKDLLGNNAAGNSLTPVPVSLPTGVTVDQIAAGGAAYALTDDGRIYAWGIGQNLGQLGAGGIVNAPTPVQVSSANVSTGLFSDVSARNNTAYALGSDGLVYAWGMNNYGQIGVGGAIPGTNRNVPVQVQTPVGLTFTQVAAGGNTGYALDENGQAYAWGWGIQGRLGNGGTADSSTPVPVTMPAGVSFTAIAAGSGTAYGLGDDGNVYAWGTGGNGELGNGVPGPSGSTNVFAAAPVPVLLPPGITVTQIAATNQNGYALTDDGIVYAWGIGDTGQLGTGAAPPGPFCAGGLCNPTPGAVQNPPGVTYTSLGTQANTAYATGSDGHTYAWGSHAAGNLGMDLCTVEPIGCGRSHNPVQVVDDLTVTGVTFGGVAGANFAATPVSGGAQWSADTPAGCGPVDVVVSWTQFGATTTTFPGGFAYGSAPAITAQPSSGSLARGDVFTATVGVSGEDAPVIRWQQEGPSDAWTDVVGALGATLTVTELSEPTNFRAVATNCWGEAAAAISTTITVDIPADGDPGDGDPGDDVPAATDPAATELATTESADDPATAVGGNGPSAGAGGQLARTGAAATAWVLPASILILLTGVGLLGAVHRIAAPVGGRIRSDRVRARRRPR